MNTITAETAVDPVCGMTINPKNAAASSEVDGQTIFFCSRSCKSKFDAAPENYAAADCCSTSGHSCC